MLVANVESVNEDMYACWSLPLKRFLCEHKGLNYVGVKRDSDLGKNIWYFSQTDELQNAIDEWRDRKARGDLFYKK